MNPENENNQQPSQSSTPTNPPFSSQSTSGLPTDPTVPQPIQPQVFPPTEGSPSSPSAPDTSIPIDPTTKRPMFSPESIYPTPPEHRQPLSREEAEKAAAVFDKADKKKKLRRRLLLVIPTVVGMAVIIAVLIASGILPFTKFKTVAYDNGKGSHYKLKFYSNHSTKDLKSKTKQLVSRVELNGKYPLTLTISSSESKTNNQLENCASFRKVFEVQNNNVNKKIAVCDILKGSVSGQETKDTVYVASFTHNDHVQVVTIAQDYNVDFSNQAAAQESLKKFGLSDYRDDIKTILASIEVK